MKADEQITATLLTDILRDMWESEEAPLSWKTGLIIKLPKKGDLTNCDNWKGIMLLSVTYKVLSRVVFDRLTTQKTVDPLLTEKNKQGSGREEAVPIKSSLFGKSWNRVMNSPP